MTVGADDVVTLDQLLGDLVDEHDDLDRLVSDLGDADWDRPTPAPGWAVRDQISHLAFFDEAAVLAMSDPEAFEARARALITAPGDPMQEHLDRGRAITGRELLAWWRQAAATMVSTAASLPSGARLAWFGPPMGGLSFVSARLMETWAHGQDVADALGRSRTPTARLRHIARLGVRTRAFSYQARGLTAPQVPVEVDLVAPDGSRWRLGDAGAEQSVTGPALDFCLVVARRRHRADTALEVTGPEAAAWMDIAQVFAGPPGEGRRPLA